jgi:hypothetical protein
LKVWALHLPAPVAVRRPEPRSPRARV